MKAGFDKILHANLPVLLCACVNSICLFYSTSAQIVNAVLQQHNHHHFMAIIQVNLLQLTPPVKNWRILLVQSFNTHMPLLTATSAFGLGRRCWSSPQQCYQHCLCTL